MFTAVTSFSPAGYDLYGKRFIESFRRFWSPSIQLIVAWEGEQPEANLTGFDLLGADPAKSFFARHYTNPIVHGLLEMVPAEWVPKAKKEGYSWRHDAYRFSHKVFAICRAAKLIEQGKLFWVDADVFTRKPVTETLLNSLLPDSTSLCYLNRGRYLSELSFVGYNLERDEVAHFLSAYEDVYASDDFLKLAVWDDCNVFDHLVQRLNPATSHIPFPLNKISRKQPFDTSVLGACMTHLKGRRKEEMCTGDRKKLKKMLRSL